ncbi:hypothetical protein N7520_008085 [Penicillium odoratum]|uniref:uncharacterized protein n=1 Tax=Penicillium odoratum TaxID=1167516 RepID=UPI002549C019|nr:uncharacterized protein N7520_008085 [Penicillium odoratum]KAJ5760929.1 hypothetical protein N7520_008085 [Penicillium odoratum]
MAQPIPVVLCGRTEKIGTAVIAALKPEFEVIHFIMTPEAGLVQIPALLRGEADVPSDSELGSKSYERGVGAIILGAGYEDEDIQRLREAAGTLSTVPWLRPDTTKPAPPLGPAYGQALVERIKETVNELQASAKLAKDAVVWY